MFDKHKLSRGGVQAQALVLEKKVYAFEANSGRASACRYKLRVKFDDGSTTDVSLRVLGVTPASAAVGAIVPVRYDPADRSKLEIDRDAIKAQHDATAREVKARAIAEGEQALGLAPTAPAPARADTVRLPDTGALRIGDADRELIGTLLTQHMADGRLSADELEERIGALYTSQTREQARSVLAGLPVLAARPGSVDGEHDGAIPALPDWLRVAESPVSQRVPAQAGRPGAGVSANVPTDGEMSTAYKRWQAKAAKMKADKAAQQDAEAAGDQQGASLARRRLIGSRAEEKSARAKYDQLHKRRPDWSAGGS